jgi:predicted nucleic acid-binding protein
MADPIVASAVIDASALVDLLLNKELAAPVAARLAGHVLHAPAHLDAEVFSALGRLHRAGSLDTDEVSGMLGDLESARIERHPTAGLVRGAWARRDQLRLVDALYVELAEVLGLRLVTTDRRLRPLPAVDVIEV